LRECRALHYTENMNDTESASVMSVKLPLELSKRVERIASELGLSSAEVVHAAIRQGLKQTADVRPRRRNAAAKPKNR